MSNEIEYNEDDLIRARAIMAADDRKRAAELAAARRAYLEPVLALVNTKAWTQVMAEIARIRSDFVSEGNLSMHVDAIGDIATRLTGAALAPAVLTAAEDAATATPVA